MRRENRLKSFQDLAAHLKEQPRKQEVSKADGLTKSTASRRVQTSKVPTQQTASDIPALQVGWWKEHRGIAVLHPNQPHQAFVILNSSPPPEFEVVACDAAAVKRQLSPVGPPATKRALAIYADWAAGRIKDVATREREAKADVERKRAEARARQFAVEQRRQRELRAQREEQLRQEKELLRRRAALGKLRRQTIESECTRRGIELLVHFTDARNVPTILREGLIPLTELRRQGARVFVSDRERYDQHPDSISLSVEFPNYEMFFRKRNEDPQREWAVIGLDRCILWELDCAFLPNNAASREFRSADDYTAPDRFLLLFDDLQAAQRDALGIPDRLPTHPQSEILVFGRIPRERIRFLHFRSDSEIFRTARAEYGGSPHKVCIDDGYFRPRVDWKYWWEQKQSPDALAPGHRGNAGGAAL